MANRCILCMPNTPTVMTRAFTGCLMGSGLAAVQQTCTCGPRRRCVPEVPTTDEGESVMGVNHKAVQLNRHALAVSGIAESNTGAQPH